MDQLDVVIKTACIALPAWGPVFPCFFPVFCGSGWVVGAGCFVWGLLKKKILEKQSSRGSRMLLRPSRTILDGSRVKMLE